MQVRNFWHWNWWKSAIIQCTTDNIRNIIKEISKNILCIYFYIIFLINDLLVIITSSSIIKINKRFYFNYLVRAYSLSPSWIRLALKVPMQPLNWSSLDLPLPSFCQVTKRGLHPSNSCLFKINWLNTTQRDTKRHWGTLDLGVPFLYLNVLAMYQSNTHTFLETPFEFKMDKGRRFTPSVSPLPNLRIN